MAVFPRFLAFYLPQFHPVPENDAWWGKGFTEWTNVAKAQPMSKGHYQPHLPADLGFYDLRLEETRIAQAELAKAHGIHGFCYYHYWFNGKMLLERPFNEVLDSRKPDFPFCLCWANENWTRTWDGLSTNTLIGQDYKNYQVEEHFEWLANAFSDPRYIKINEKPLFLIYRADQIPQLGTVIEKMRKTSQRLGFKDIYLCAVKNTQFSLTDKEAIGFGLDALIDFQPSARQLPQRTIKTPAPILSLYGLWRKKSVPIGYKEFIQKIINAPLPEMKTFPCVFPSWDNTARRKTSVTIIQNTDANLFKRFLASATTKIEHYPEQEHIVFINAWNEWAEGCHMEPDLKNGHNFLLALKSVVDGPRP